MQRPDDRFESFHLWTNVPPRRRWRIHCPSVAIWGALALVSYAALAAVVWAVGRVL